MNCPGWESDHNQGLFSLGVFFTTFAAMRLSARTRLRPRGAGTRPHLRPRDSRLRLGVGLLATILGSSIMLVDAEAAYPSYAKRERMSCVTCHAAPTGGALTVFGREYRWNASPPEPSDLEAAKEQKKQQLGIWSGESVSWFRLGKERVLGKQETQQVAEQSIRLYGDELLGNERLRFVGEAFGRANFGAVEGFDDDTAELVTAEVQYQAEDAATALRAGRHWISVGVGSRRIDGVSLTHRPSSRVTVDAYGGVPAPNGFGGSDGDLYLGGRVGYRRNRKFDLGVSAVYGKDASDPTDVRYGVDLFYSPHRNVDFTGHVNYDWIGDEFYDQRFHVVFKPDAFWQFAADYSRTIPGAFLPKNNIFSVFSDDDYEEISVVVTRRISDRVSVRIVDRATFYDDSSKVNRIGGRLDVRYGPNGEDAVGVELSYDDEGREGRGGTRGDSDALFARIYHLFVWTNEIYTSLDAFGNFHMGDPFDRDSRLLRLVLGYRPQDAWDVQIGGELLQNPEFTSTASGFVRLTVRF